VPDDAGVRFEAIAPDGKSLGYENRVLAAAGYRVTLDQSAPVRKRAETTWYRTRQSSTPSAAWNCVAVIRSVMPAKLTPGRMDSAADAGAPAMAYAANSGERCPRSPQEAKNPDTIDRRRRTVAPDAPAGWPSPSTECNTPCTHPDPHRQLARTLS
jgi:hypothetical protein